jgi:hypothetical protein
MNGYVNRQLWPCGQDRDLNNDAESVLSQSEELEKVVKSAFTTVYFQSH